MSILDIRLFGHFQITQDGAQIPGAHRARLESLLAYLLLHEHVPLQRAHVAFQLWPDSTESQARGNLRKTLHALRRELPDAEKFLYADARVVQWVPDSPFSLDVARFDQYLDQASQLPDVDLETQQHLLEQAVTLYGGDLLPSCYDDWIIPFRERLRQRFIGALDMLVTIAEQRGDYAVAIDHADHLLRVDPLHELTSVRLMRLQASVGNRAAALRVYEQCRTLLADELGVDPGEEIQGLYAQLLEGETLEAHDPTGGSSTSELVPLVGRAREWRALGAAWQAAAPGQVALCLINGEAGIGKTRLAEELLHWASVQRIRTATARSYEAGGALSLAPVADLLRSPALRPGLTELDAVWAGEIARLLPELASERADLSPAGPLGEGWQRRRFMDALVRAVDATPDELILFLDDLHWADRETLDWLDFLMHAELHARILVVGAYRREEVTSQHPLTALLLNWRREGLAVEIPLAPLSAQDSRTLAQLFVGADLAEDAAREVVRMSEGNPLFVVEMARVDSGDWRLESGEAGLPSKVQAVIGYRLSQLSIEARSVASLAATIGRSFSHALLSAAGRFGDDDLTRSLDELWQRRIIREQSAATYDFTHDRIREAVYDGVSPPQRRHWHERVAQALGETHANDLDAVCGQIAVHYERAGQSGEAFTWRKRAADAARGLHAIYEAIDHFRASLALLELLPAKDERQRERFALLVELAMQLDLSVGIGSKQSGQVYEEAYALVGNSDDYYRAIRVRTGLRIHYLTWGDPLGAVAIVDEAMSIAEQVGDEALIAGLRYKHASTYAQIGDLTRCLDLFRQAEASPTRDTLVPSTVGLALWSLGYVQEALDLLRRDLAEARQRTQMDQVYRRDLTEARQRTNLIQIHVALLGIALVELMGGMYEQAIETTNQLIEHGLAYEMAPSHIDGGFLQGYALVCLGDSAAGMRKLDLQFSEQVNGWIYLPLWQALVVESLIKQNRLHEADALLGEALELSDTSGLHFWDAELHRLRGVLTLESGGDLGEVEASYLVAVEIARRQEAKALELRAVMDLCRLWREQGKAAQAKSRLAEIYTWFTQGHDTADLVAARRMLENLA